MREQSPLLTSRQALKLSMPLDKQTNGKPVTPALSSNFRSNSKSPLTPRLVGSGANSPASSTRRDAFVRTRSPAREQPAAKPLNGNITPRTAARRSRIGTESPATPGSNQAAAITRPRAASISQTGLGISSPNNQVKPVPAPLATSVISPTPACALHRRVSGTRSAVQGQDGEDTRFFHASDARSYVSESLAAQADPRSFYFVGSPADQSVSSSRLSSTRELHQSSVDAKFFHASDARSQTTSKPHARPALGSKNKTFSAPSYAFRGQHIETTKSEKTVPPSNSPKKVHSPSTPPGSPAKSPAGNVLPPVSSPRQYVDRRGSGGSSLSMGMRTTQPGHQKSLSTCSISGADGTPKQWLSEPPTASAVALKRLSASFTFPQSSTSNTILSGMPTASPKASNANQTRAFSGAKTEPTISSPTSDTFSDPSQTSSSRPPQDVANARRERNVLDLEISNSSLLAINKTLEKELRKQNTELRRFRRLSRSGKLSLAPTNRSISESTLGTLTEGESRDFDQSGSENDSDSEMVDDDETDILSNDSSSVHSPTSRARQRARDEKRLMLDLSKHQQLLLDSQKLTQSIRRCLTCTEELIGDGNKALEYRVGIGDIRLGGKVLNHEESHEKASDSSDKEVEQRRGLLSPSVTMSQLEEATLWLTSGVGARSEEPESVNGTLDAINAELDAI